MEEVCVNFVNISNDIEQFNNQETVKYIPCNDIEQFNNQETVKLSNDVEELDENELALYNYVVNTYIKNVNK
jgi:hypothetical protein